MTEMSIVDKSLASPRRCTPRSYMRSKRVLDKSLASPRPRLQTGETLPDGSTVSHVVVKNESGVVQSAGTQTDPVHTVNVDPDGKVPGMEGYTGPIVQVGTLPAIQADYTEENPNGDSIQTTNKTIEHTFHNAEDTPGEGTIYGCDGQHTRLILEITKSAGVETFELHFLGSISGTGTIYQPLIGAKIGTDGSITTAVKSTSTTTEIWEIDVTGRKYIKMDLITISGTGATVTVKGVLV